MIYFLRTIHVALGSFFTVCLVYLGYVGFTMTEITSFVWGAMATLIGETVVFVASGWKCPLSALQRRYGDEKGFLGLFLPVEVARAVFPVVLVIGAIPVALILWRVVR